VPGLSDFQQKLVNEEAEAFARQLVGRPVSSRELSSRWRTETIIPSRHLLLFGNQGLRGCKRCSPIRCMRYHKHIGQRMYC
jgi:hypothetical protein